MTAGNQQTLGHVTLHTMPQSTMSTELECSQMKLTKTVNERYRREQHINRHSTVSNQQNRHK